MPRPCLPPLKSWSNLSVDSMGRPFHAECPAQKVKQLRKSHETFDKLRGKKASCFVAGELWTEHFRPKSGPKKQKIDGLSKQQRWEADRSNQAIGLDSSAPLSKIRKLNGSRSPGSLLDLALPVCQRSALLEVVRRSMSVLSCVPYSVIQGSALGIGRDKAILPWDDDFDIGVLVGHREEVRFRVERSASFALSLHTVSHGLDRIYFAHGGQPVPKTLNGRRLGGDHAWTWPYVDVVYFKPDGYAARAKEGYPEEHVVFDKFRMVELIHGFSVKVMRNLNGYLADTYGEHWKTKAKAHNWSHIHNRKIFVDTDASYSAKTAEKHN